MSLTLKKKGDPMNYLGIDPGLSGGLALIGKDGVLWAEDMPTITVKSGKKNQRFIDLVALRTLIVGALFVGIPSQPVHVFIEKVSAMPGQGVSSMFKFGRGFGNIEAMIAAFELPFTMIHPKTWQKEMLRDIPGDGKGRSVLAAQRLFPDTNLVPFGCKKPSDGRADALLIAEYGRRTN